jgi:lipopolysaccharide biosynthesis regulator YciM
MFSLKRKNRPTSQEAYIAALKRMIDGDAESALQALQTAVRSGQAPTDAYIRLGNLLRLRGDVSKAVQIHQSLTVKTDLTKEEKVELFLNLAEDFAAMGNSEKSVRTLETAVKTLNIKDPLVFLKIAKQYHVLGETDKAYDALKEARKYGGLGERELALYLASAAANLMEKEDTKEARKTLNRALKHDANCAPAQVMAGDLAEAAGEIDEAIDRWRRAAVLSPQLAPTVLHKLETILFDKGRFGEIEKIYNDVRHARGSDESALLGIAAFYKKQGRGDEAIQLLEDYLTVVPDSVRCRLLLASLFAKYRDMETLEHFLDQSIKDAMERRPYVCRSCQYQSDSMRWHCPRCNAFDSFSTDNEI